MGNYFILSFPTQKQVNYGWKRHEAEIWPCSASTSDAFFSRHKAPYSPSECLEEECALCSINFLFNKTCIAKGVATLQSRSLQGRQSRWAQQHSVVDIALISCRNEESDSKHVVVEWKASWYHFSAMLTKNSVIFFRLMNEFLSSNCFQHTTMMIVYQSNV